MSEAPMPVPADEVMERQEVFMFSCRDCNVEFPQWDDETPETCPNCGGFQVFLSDSYAKR